MCTLGVESEKHGIPNISLCLILAIVHSVVTMVTPPITQAANELTTFNVRDHMHPYCNYCSACLMAVGRLSCILCADDPPLILTMVVENHGY